VAVGAAREAGTGEAGFGLDGHEHTDILGSPEQARPFVIVIVNRPSAGAREPAFGRDR
jgi:hypothetical protein